MDDRSLREIILDQKVVYQGKIIRLEHWNVLLPNGHKALREIACHPGASAIVPIDDDGQVILVRQARVAVDRITLEIPAGKLDSPSEDPLDCAVRELSEETGMTAETITKLTCMETTPGFCNERIHLYLAQGLRPGQSHPDDDEFVSVVRLPLQEAVERVMAGEMRDGKTCLGILMAARYLAGNPSSCKRME